MYKMIRPFRSLFLSLILLSSSLLIANAQATPAATASESSTLTVQANNAIGAINPLVYGANDGPWSVVPGALLPQAQAAGITYLRFPGGNWGDDNDLSDFDIDFFMTFARAIKAEPSISVRLKGGTPEKAAQVVHYVNIEQKYNVHYWSIGNEPNLFPNYTVDQYNKDWRAFAKAMLAVDPSIVLVGPDISQWPPPSDPSSTPYRDWMSSFLKANGDLVNIVSVHRYPFPLGQNGPLTTIDQLRAAAPEWDRSIPDLRTLITQITGKALPIGVTEANSHWSNGSVNGPATPDSFYNAIWWADSLGYLIRQRVDLVDYFTLDSYASTGPFGLMAHDNVRPTYYVYLLYQKLGNNLVASASTDPDITITAATRADGTLTLMIVNPTEQDRTITLNLTGYKAGQQAELWRLDPTHNATKIGSTDEIATGQVTLPAQSASAYIVPKG